MFQSTMSIRSDLCLHVNKVKAFDVNLFDSKLLKHGNTSESCFILTKLDFLKY